MICVLLLLVYVPTHLAAQSSGNPLFPGWYADPEGEIFGDTYWIYPTYSAGYFDQTFMDAFSSKDLVNWTKHERVIDGADVSWADYAMWAPSIEKKDERYYLFFGANDIQNNNQTGGIGVAVSDRPEGPFVDHIGEPLIDAFHNGAQPIDQYVFKDTDGQYYLIYGGHGHCNIVRLNDEFNGILPFADGELYKEITPAGYVEGSFMFVRDGKYYFMWSEGFWGASNYRVAYAISDNPLGPFERKGTILREDASIAKGAGHHSVIQQPGEDEYYILYHRRPLDKTGANDRQVCIEHMYFEPNGDIRPVKLTNEGVPAKRIGSGDDDDGNDDATNGLLGEYFDGMNFETPVLSRVDRAVDFDWGNSSPDGRVSDERFSVRWTGTITPRYSEDYTFYLNTDNGRRLWIDGELVVDAWVDDWDIEYAGSIRLEAGRKYAIRMEYFEHWGDAYAKLEWSSGQQGREVVPAAQLSPTGETNGRSSELAGPLALFPNPTSHTLRVAGAVAGKRYVLYSALGEELRSYGGQELSEPVLVADLPNGMYFLRETESGVTSRFVKR